VKRIAGLLLLLAVVAVTSQVHAAEEEEAPISPRPFRTASVELNPLAVLIGRFGGQLQVGVVDGLAFVASASVVELSSTAAYKSSDPSSYDGEQQDAGPSGHYGLSGVQLELGPRFYIPLGRRSGQPAWLWGGLSMLHDRLRQFSTTSDGPFHQFEGSPFKRYGVALDFGAHVPIHGGFYASGGVGVLVRTPVQFIDDGGGMINDVMQQKGALTPRLLFAFGWGS
jgi:hypothetical protein